MEKYSRVITLAGRTFRASETMADIFLAHASDIAARRQTELVPLLHEGGVDMLLVGPTTVIELAEVESGAVAQMAVAPSAISPAA